MNRITEKNGNFYRLKYDNEVYGLENGIRLVQIIGRLENLLEKYNISDLEYLERCIIDHDKYGELGEQLGCSLEIAFKALKDGIYVEDKAFNTFEKHDVRGIGLKSLSVISKICDYAECDFSCYYEDYKKTWWLKEDKTE